MTSKGAWRVPHDVGVVFCLCGFCIARKKKSVLGKKTSKRQSGQEEDPRKAPCAAWDRFSFKVDDRCTPGNILKGLSRRWWNVGSNTGSCRQAECGYRQHGQVKTGYRQEGTQQGTDRSPKKTLWWARFVLPKLGYRSRHPLLPLEMGQWKQAP